MKRPAAATAKKPAAATAKKPVAAKKQAAAKKPAADVDTVVRVKYTHPMNPVRTYCQALVDEKWRHVITVAEKEHAEHRAIVQAVGEGLCKRHPHLPSLQAPEGRPPPNMGSVDAEQLCSQACM